MIQLVKRSISGDADAFLELMEKNSLAMYKVARGILDNDEDAADAMQDTILTCFEKIHPLKNPEYFKTGMIRILINECNKIHRHLFLATSSRSDSFYCEIRENASQFHF